MQNFRTVRAACNSELHRNSVHGDRGMRILDVLYTPVRRPQPARCEVLTGMRNRKGYIGTRQSRGTRKRIPEILLAGSIIRTYNGMWFAVGGRDGAHHIGYRCRAQRRIRLFYRRPFFGTAGKFLRASLRRFERSFDGTRYERIFTYKRK